MTDLTPTEDLPAPRPDRSASNPARVGRAGRSRAAVVAAVVAVAVGIGGGALASDAVGDDGSDLVQPTATARPVPVLVGGPLGSSLSAAVAEYAADVWSQQTRGVVLSAWGAAFSDLLGAGGEGVPPDDPDAVLADDPRLVDDTGGSGFVDPCAGTEPGADVPEGCDEGLPGEVLDPEAAPANVVAVVAFPHPDVALAAECPFADVGPGELPLAVITGNPGRTEVRVGDQEVVVESTPDEIAEWETWRADPAGPRPPESFVAHCIALPAPASTEPVPVTAVTEDDAGQVAVAETTLVPVADDLPPVTLTPLDGTLVRIDVPVDPARPEPFVAARTVADFGASPPSCEGIGDTPGPSPWRVGADALAEVAPPPGDRPYLDAAPAIHRFTVPLPEGEPSLVCVTRPDDAGATVANRFLVTPPDARRLRLAVTQLDLTDGVADGDIQVRGTFAELAWTPCGASLPDGAAEAGTTDPGSAGALCSSGGDTGAIAGAGGVLDVTVRVGTVTHRVAISLSATPGGPAEEQYRIAVPSADLGGVLCVDGADQEGCIPAEGDAVLGSVVVTASWSEGPIGPADWQIEPLATS